MNKKKDSIICPSVKKEELSCNICPQVSNDWDIDLIIEKMNFAKQVFDVFGEGKTISDLDNGDRQLLDNHKPTNLTPREKCWLRLLLKGWDREKIEKHLKLKKDCLRKEFSSTIYKYIYVLTGKTITNWAQVRLYLEESYPTSRNANINPVRKEEVGIMIKIPKTVWENLNQKQRDSFLQKFNELLEGEIIIEGIEENEK